MFQTRSLAFKFILFFSTSTLLIFSLVLFYSYRSSRDIIQKNQEKDALNTARLTAARIQNTLTTVEKAAQSLADNLEYTTWSETELQTLIRTTIQATPDIYGSAVAFEPRSRPGKPELFAPYFYRFQGGVKHTDLARESYAYLLWDWYQIPKELGSPQWSEPYYDEGGGNILMSTYSVPLYSHVGKERRFIGIVTADVSLEGLQSIVSSIKIMKTGYGFLISRNGAVVTHPDKKLIMNETLFSLAEARNDTRLWDLGRKMIHGESGAASIRDFYSQKDCWMTYTPIPSSRWSLAVLFPKEEMLADIHDLYRNQILLAFIGLVLFSGAVIFISGTITRPLRAMAKATADIAQGNLDGTLPPVTSHDEVGQMAAGFETMQRSLKEYIRKLTETTAAKERIESELGIARKIQMSILPKQLPVSASPAFDLLAVIEPAREVGGDFYDFFMIDDRQLCFLIADVSGKGIPAALFMAFTKTLVKATARSGLNPAAILTQVNQELAAENETTTFVTLFYGLLDIETGEVRYANAGHNPPLLVQRMGQAAYLDKPGGLVLGALEGINYQEERLRLEPGEYLFLYTDGVTEAMNRQEALFGEERLLRDLNGLSGRPLEEIAMGIMDKVKTFSQGLDQSDDITMLVLKYNGLR
jgi:phosphoserine phosphatase RsbU/P